MKITSAAIVGGVFAALAFSAPVTALGDEGDAAKGESQFKRCKTCHSLDEGQNGVGPSLHNIVGRQAGTVEGYNYSDSYVTAGEQGLVWTVENIVAYLEDPKAFMVATLGDDDARTKMRNKFKKLELRQDIAAYLASISAPAE